MKPIHVLLTVIFLAFCIVPVHAQKSLGQTVDKLAEKYVKKKKNKGLVVGIIYGDKTWSKGYGTTGKSNAQPDENTLFEIGALTNTFTVYLTMQEELEARFSLTDPVSDYLPDSINLALYYAIVCHEIIMDSKNPRGEKIPMRLTSCSPEPSPTGRSIQFCDLISHASGFPNEIINHFRWYPLEGEKIQEGSCSPYPPDRFYKKLSRVEMISEPGLQYHYSQMGMALLGNLISDITHQDYQSLLFDKLLDPLQMNFTSLWLNDAQQPFFSQGHNYKGKKVCASQFSALAPAVGLKSNANDLLKFLSANLSGDNEYITDVLAMMRSVKISQIGEKWGKSTDLASGWFVSPIGEKDQAKVYWQNGGTAGFRSFMAYVPGTQTAVVVLSNSAQGVDQLGYEIISLLQKLKNKSSVSAMKKAN